MGHRLIPIIGCIVVLLLSVTHAEAQTEAPSLDQCRAEIESNPRNPVAYYCIYRSVISDGHFDQAADMLRHYFEENPDVYRIEMFIGWLDQMRNVQGYDALLIDAIDGMEATGDFWGVVYAGVERVPRLGLEGKNDEAQTLLERCLRAARKTGDPTMEARVWTAWASLAMNYPDHSQALHYLLKARKVVFPDGPYDIQCWVLDSLGSTYWYLCRYQEAFECFEQAFNIRGQAHDEYWQSLSASNMALCAINLMHEGRMDQRQVHALVTRGLESAVNSGNLESQASLLQLQGTMERGEAGLSLLRRSLEISRRQSFIHIEIDNLQSIGTLLAEMSPEFMEESTSAFLQARQLTEEKGQPVSVGEVLAAEARIRALYDSREQGIEAHIAALNQIERTRAPEVGGSIRAQAFSRWAYVYYRLAGFILEGLDDSSTPDEDLAVAFRTLERFRARELLESLETPRKETLNTGPETDQHEDVLAHIASVQRSLSKTGLAPEVRREVLEELKDLEEQESVLKDQLLQLASEPKNRRSSKIPGLAEIQAILAPDEALLSYQLWDGEVDRKAPLDIGMSWLVLVTRNHAEAIALPARRDLRGRLEILEGFMTTQDSHDHLGIKVSVRLFEDLLKKALDQLPPETRKLVIIPDDVLFRCPFAGLRAAETALPVGSLFRLSIVPSAAVWAHLRTHGKTGPETSAALILANPTIGENAEEEFTLRAAAPWREGLRLAPLSHADEEARTLKRISGRGTVVLSGADASEAALKNTPLEGFHIIDLVTHAVVDEQQPERSAILLAPGSEQEDGFLQVREIPDLRLDGQLVILSSCRSSSGHILGGEGAQSLARAFLQAGAGAVLASLWPLEDAEAATLFSDLYRQLGRGVSVAEALRRAQASAAEGGLSSATWAGLTILGNGDLTPLNRQRLIPWYWIPIGFALLVLIGIRFRRRPR